jgi:polyphosphate glucokinase
VSGQGFEVVLTLGAGLGTAFFLDGKLLPHFEFSHHPYRKGQTYNQAIGEATRKKIGRKRWHNRVHHVIESIRLLTFYDRCYVGGGNASRLDPHELPPGVTIVSNDAGITGGIKLWERT